MDQLTLLIMKVYRPERGANRYRMCLSIVVSMLPDRIREWNESVRLDPDDTANLFGLVPVHHNSTSSAILFFFWILKKCICIAYCRTSHKNNVPSWEKTGSRTAECIEVGNDEDNKR